MVDNFEQLLSGTLLAPISLDEFVARVGLNAFEIEQGPDWQTWHDERYWTSAINSSCGYLRRLYCFENGYSER